MAQYRAFRLTAAICLVLNGASSAAICTGWKIGRIELERTPYLLGCAAAATLLSVTRLLAACAHHPHRKSAGCWQLAWLCNVLEVIVLSAFFALLFTTASARQCLDSGGTSDFCKLRVCVTAALCVLLAKV